MAEKSQLEVGQRVKFRRMHDKALELTGKITAIHEGDDLVEIATEADGRVIEVETSEQAHANDVTPVAEVTAVDEGQSHEEGPAGETGAESRSSRRARRFGGV